MSMSPGALVRRTMDLNYDDKRRTSSTRWLLANCALLALLLYDLWSACPGQTGVWHAAEACAAGLCGAAVLAHAARLLPARRAVLPLTPRQRRLLGLPADRLDSSFRLVDESGDSGGGSSAESPASLSPPRAWRRGADSPPPAAAGDTARASRAPADRFIDSARALARYLRAADAPAPPGPPAPPYAPPSPPPYQLAAPAPAAAQPTAQARSPQLWRRLRLDPQRLTQFNLNLRLWLSATVLQRVAGAAEAAERALAAHGLGGARLERGSLERLRALSPDAAPQLPALLPFLDAFPDQRYAVQRIKELAQGGCMSAYRWAAGGAEWDESRPTDAELVMHLFATYMDLQMPGAGGGPQRAFSAAHVSAAPAPPSGSLCIHRTSRRPPHYVLSGAAWGGAEGGAEGGPLEACAGRANLLHTLLLFLAAVARRPPPSLRRLNLGPHGLNMLWIIGR